MQRTSGSSPRAHTAVPKSNGIGGICFPLILSGCSIQSWRPADYQLDIRGASLVDTDRIRICIDDFGMRESAVGAGRIAFTGLPLDAPLRVTVDALMTVDGDTGDADDTAQGSVTQRDIQMGRAGPIELNPDTPWLETDWNACNDACDACQSPGSLTSAGSRTSTLAIRFLD